MCCAKKTGGEILAAEALVRWQHPTRGLLAPDAFIGVAESINLAGELGRWVMRSACADFAAWQSRGLGENIVRVLAELGAASPFPIQAATIAPILEGRDVLARGRTGSGKTIAFGAPLVESILRSQAGSRREFGRSPKALVLAPTRELALQIDRTIQPIARSVGLFTTQKQW